MSPSSPTPSKQAKAPPPSLKPTPRSAHHNASDNKNFTSGSHRPFHCCECHYRLRPCTIANIHTTTQLCFVSISVLAPHPYKDAFPSLIYPSHSTPPPPPPDRPPLPPSHPDAVETQPAHANAPSSPPQPHRENATFFMLTTNSESDIRGAVQSVRELEDRFNHRYHYPWIFLNDKPFSDEFKSCARSLSSCRCAESPDAILYIQVASRLLCPETSILR